MTTPLKEPEIKAFATEWYRKLDVHAPMVELLPMLAAGVAAREGSHWLRRRYPEYRKLISISVAGIATFVLGHAAIQYFEGLSHFLSDDRSTDFPSPAMGWEIH